MGATKGTLTYTTYYVLDEPDAGYRDQFMDALGKRTFRDIDVDAGQDSAFGWVCLGEPFATELDWAKVFVDPYICLSLREDTIRVPKTAFQAHYDQREREYVVKMGRDKLKKGERANLKEMVMNELRKRALPDIRTYDVVWNTVDGTMRLWTQSKRTCELFTDLVREDWNLRIVPRTPYTVLAARSADPAVGAALLELEPADLTGVTD